MPGQAQGREAEQISLLDEIEQLRTLLESALEENERLGEDRDRLQHRVEAMSHELHFVRSRQSAPPPPPLPPTMSDRQFEAEEELRVAFEELQVLTEELEVANTSLHQTNQELDARVEERAHQIREITGALRSAQGSLRTIADLVPDLLWRCDAAGDADWFNERWFDYTGHPADAPLGRGWADVVHPLDRERALADWQRSIDGVTPYQHEQRLRAADGSYRWHLIRAQPLHDDTDAVIGWFAAGTDLHEQRMALEALRQSEIRFRTLVEGMPQLVWRAVDGGQWTWCSPQWSSYTGQSADDSCGRGWLNRFHPTDRDRAAAAWDAAEQTGGLDIEARIFHAEERRHRHFRTRALPVRDRDGAIVEWPGTSTDVDDILQLQAEQQVLVGELQHRTRNLMSVVNAVTKRTLAGSASLDQFAVRIGERFGALARVQSLLSGRDSGTRVSFDTLIRDELRAHVPIDADGGERVTLRGPTGIPVRSATIQTLALAFHELATNAVKYGALHQPGGRLEISWELLSSSDRERRLLIDWRERGVDMPAAGSAPRGGGYGRELIERALPYQLDARTHYAFEADGVHCTIDIAVPVDEGLETTDVR